MSAPAANDLIEAKKYFGDEVDFYYGRGDLKSLPSTLVKLEKDQYNVLRRGAVAID